MRRRELLLGSLLSAPAFPAAAQSLLAAPASPAPVLAPPPPNPQAAKLDDSVAAGYSRIVLARWGDPILPGAPDFTPYAPSDAQADALFPYDGVIAGILPPPPAQDGIPRLVMVVATPDIPARMVFPAGPDEPEIAGRMQGVTVVNLQYLSGRWLTVAGGYQSRRISSGTLCQISGPAAASIGTSVQGVLGPNTGCATPWGTVLLAESDAAAWLARLGAGFAAPAEGPCFGWVVELNPLDPENIPIKRTALGRIARGGMAAASTKDGRPMVFFTQDSPNGALFRFIAASAATGGTALDTGVISVATLSGTGIEWVDLGVDIPSLVGLDNAAQVAGAEMFDAPGGLALSPDGATLYMACGGNAGRSSPDALNPRAGDDNGHILSFTLPGGDGTAKNFAAALVLVAGQPGLDAGTHYPAGATCWLRKPRTLAVDAGGSLWVGTDQRGDTARTADGLFTLSANGLNFVYFAPIGAALGGAAFDAGTKTNFAMVRHPGATPSASFAAPATRWPSLAPNMPPQSTLIGLVGA